MNPLRMFAVCALLSAAPALASPKASPPAWSMNATIIEACSCPMFCQCYFTDKPAAHMDHAAMEHGGAMGHDHGGEGEHYCRANNVFRVNHGNFGATRLDGARFWLSMDLGDNFADGTMKWCVVTFDPAVTQAQRAGISEILGHLYPVKWEQPLTVASDLPIEWSHTGDKAVAQLDGGKAGEVRLDGAAVNHYGTAPAVISNLRYWGADHHDGFVLMPNQVEAYRLGPNAFEFKGTNGFMITVDVDANHSKAATKS